MTPPEPEQAVVIDASFVPKSGKQTYGLDRFWNGRHGRSEKGLEISALAWLDITANCASSRSVEQTPPTSEATAPETTRIDVYLEQLTRVISAHDLSHRRDVITDGYDSKQNFINGVQALGRHQMGTRRIDANLRYLYHGPKRLAPGRPKTYDGKVNGDDLTRVEALETEADPMVLYHQVVNHVQFQCNLRVVLVVDTKHNRRALLLSTDVDVDALTIYRYDKARFHIELLFRDAKQFTGLCDSQARSQATLDFHCKASVTAVTLARLEARQQHGDTMASFSMASLKRRACNQHLLDRICDHLAKGHRLEKSSPDYEELCNYGSMTE
ncbi:MAG TPA: transposase [Candidatus Tectomicrobia bacterium]